MKNGNPFRQGYLFYILERDHEHTLRPCAVDVFEARNDLEAIRIASAVFRACDDTFHGYNLCQGDRLVATDTMFPFGLPLYDLSLSWKRREATILTLLKALFESHACLHRSEKLAKD